MAADSRYQGKPLLRLLECYVLHAIGELPPAAAANLHAMTPKLQSIYRCSGEWHEVIASAVGIQGDMPGAIRAKWAEARARSLRFEPQTFAEQFVDANLVG